MPCLYRIGQHLDVVVNLVVPDAELIRRLTGRRVCPNCNAVYHVDTMPPKQEGICDVCGHALIQRKDDQSRRSPTAWTYIKRRRSR